MSLSDLQIDHYSRQILVPEIGGRGQRQLLRSSFTVRGDSLAAGIAASYLAAAGVARADSADLVIADSGVLHEVQPAKPAPPLIAIGGSDRPWYTRGTTTATCRECLTTPAGTEKPDPSGESTAACTPYVVGAAAALEAMRLLLGRAPQQAAHIAFEAGGTRRHIHPLAECRHGTARVTPA